MDLTGTEAKLELRAGIGMNINRKRIIVVGGGPAGAVTAGLLAQNQFQVILLEKQTEVQRKVCGEYLCPSGVTLANNIGLGELLKKIGTPIRGMKIVTAHGTKIMSSFPNSRINPGLSLHRKDLDQALLKWAEEKGAQIRYGESFHHFKFLKSELVVVLETGEEISAEMVIGADGRHSQVSRAFLNTHLPKRESRSHHRIAIHSYLSQSPWGEPYFGEMHLFKDGAYIGLDPIHPSDSSKAEWNISLVCDARIVQEKGGPELALKSYIQNSNSLRARFDRSEGFDVLVVSPVSHWTKSIIPHSRVALVGDASGFIDPLTGEGMYQAMASAKYAADAISDFPKNPKRAARVYQKKYRKQFKSKKLFNLVLQAIIHKPAIVEKIAQFFVKSNARAEVFLGIIGNVYSPQKGIWILFKSKYFNKTQRS